MLVTYCCSSDSDNINNDCVPSIPPLHSRVPASSAGRCCSWLIQPPQPQPSPHHTTPHNITLASPALWPQVHHDSQRQVRRKDLRRERTSRDICFSLNVLCFPFQIGKVKITIFHLLVACTFVFTYLWGYIIYNTIIKNDQVSINVPLSSASKWTYFMTFSGWYETISCQACPYSPRWRDSETTDPNLISIILRKARNITILI